MSNGIGALPLIGVRVKVETIGGMSGREDKL